MKPFIIHDMSDFQETLEQLNIDAAIANHAEEQHQNPQTEEHHIFDFHYPYSSKAIQVVSALAFAEVLTLTGAGIASILPANSTVASALGSFFHGMSCGIGKNLVMSVLADDFKEAAATKKIESMLSRFLSPETSSYLSKEIAITALSFVGASLNDARSGLNKIFFSAEIAKTIDLNPPPFETYYNRLIELAIGRVAKNFVKDVVLPVLPAQSTQPIDNTAIIPSFNKPVPAPDTHVFTEKNVVPSVIADMAKAYAKDIWRNGSDYEKIFSFKKFAVNFAGSLTKPFSTFLYKDYIQPSLFGNPATEESGSWKKFFDSMLSSTTSSIAFTAIAKWIKIVVD